MYVDSWSDVGDVNDEDEDDDVEEEGGRTTGRHSLDKVRMTKH